MAIAPLALAALGGGAALAGGSTAAAMLAGGLGLGLAAKAMKKDKAPAVQAPTKPPQETQKPERPTVVANNAAAAGPGGAMSGNSGTFLTGPSGVDPSTLNLGKNTLLGQ
jgi:hypothetical protein